MPAEGAMSPVLREEADRPVGGRRGDYVEPVHLPPQPPLPEAPPRRGSGPRQGLLRGRRADLQRLLHVKEDGVAWLGLPTFPSSTAKRAGLEYTNVRCVDPTRYFGNSSHVFEGVTLTVI